MRERFRIWLEAFGRQIMTHGWTDGYGTVIAPQPPRQEDEPGESDPARAPGDDHDPESDLVLAS